MLFFIFILAQSCIKSIIRTLWWTLCKILNILQFSCYILRFLFSFPQSLKNFLNCSFSLQIVIIFASSLFKLRGNAGNNEIKRAEQTCLMVSDYQDLRHLFSRLLEWETLGTPASSSRIPLIYLLNVVSFPIRREYYSSARW